MNESYTELDDILPGLGVGSPSTGLGNKTYPQQQKSDPLSPLSPTSRRSQTKIIQKVSAIMQDAGHSVETTPSPREYNPLNIPTEDDTEPPTRRSTVESKIAADWDLDHDGSDADGDGSGGDHHHRRRSSSLFKPTELPWEDEMMKDYEDELKSAMMQMETANPGVQLLIPRTKAMFKTESVQSDFSVADSDDDDCPTPYNEPIQGLGIHSNSKNEQPATVHEALNRTTDQLESAERTLDKHDRIIKNLQGHIEAKSRSLLVVQTKYEMAQSRILDLEAENRELRRDAAVSEGYLRSVKEQEFLKFTRIIDATVEHREFKEKVLRAKLQKQMGLSARLKAKLMKYDPDGAKKFDITASC